MQALSKRIFLTSCCFLNVPFWAFRTNLIKNCLKRKYQRKAAERWDHQKVGEIAPNVEKRCMELHLWHSRLVYTESKSYKTILMYFVSKSIYSVVT